LALPARIQRDLDAANALLAPPQQDPQVALPNPAEPLAEVTQVQSPAATPAAPPVAPPPPPPQEDWEHKYKTLQGVHNRHVGDLKQRVAELEAHLDRVRAQPAAAPATPQAPVLNPQDAETFGSDLVEMVRRTAEGIAGNTIESLNTRIAQLEQQLAGATAVASKTADEVFYERLDALVPDWATVNADEGFLAWLSEVDPMYGTPRQTALTQAGNVRDVNRVAHVFNLYKGTVPAKPKPASRQEPTVTPRTSGNGAAQAVPAGGNQQVITVQQVEAFYKDVQRGLYRGRDTEMLQQEAIINAALAENRIVDARHVPRSM
jgi:hypothetical protein